MTVDLDMAPRWTLPDRRVDAVRGCAAIERGPLVYCFEQADQADGAGDTVVATAIPYFQWDNRDRGAMRVWLPAGESATGM